MWDVQFIQRILQWTDAALSIRQILNSKFLRLVLSRLHWSYLTFLSTPIAYSSIIAASSSSTWSNLLWNMCDIFIALSWCRCKAFCSSAYFPVSLWLLLSFVMRSMISRNGNHTRQWPCLLVTSACANTSICEQATFITTHAICRTRHSLYQHAVHEGCVRKWWFCAD